MKYCCLVCTLVSFLISGSLAVFGTEHDSSGFFWVGFVSGIFLIIAAHGAVATFTLFKEPRNAGETEKNVDGEKKNGA